jgi:hypothetical protein
MIGVRRRAWLVGLIMALGLTLPVRAADAPVNGLNLTISPSPVELTASPGTDVATTIRIRNNNLQPEQLKVTLLKFGPSGSSGEAQIASFGPGDVYKNWVSFSQTQFTVDPSDWQDIQMKIDLPRSASSDYYYAVVFSRAGATETSPGKNSLSGAVASLVLLTADTPGLKHSMQLAAVSTTKQLYEYLPVSFQIKVRNTGQAYGAPVGNIFIMHGKKQVATLQVNQDAGSVLVNSARTFTSNWSDGYPLVVSKQLDGATLTNQYGNPKTTLKWGALDPSKIRFGHYTAKVALAYSDGDTEVPLEGSISFWVIPWKLLLALLLIVSIFGVGLFTIARGVGHSVHRRK